ncbi:hypothetical protein [Nonomuraea sp. SYSU D8015]|uniref:hypothetical protein n=1 Tax=Nonomuraea sp. SYSU D8015 TaxID=2593644 RepID=UPI00166049F4|nr:hypothetical protein [Nonomuraea sp. SYSU D8015]
MGFDHGVRLREECWKSLGERVRARLEELTGRTLGWYATEDRSDPGDRRKAVVFGERGLCLAEPRIDTQHRPVYSITGYLLDPTSFRSKQIDHRPAPDRDAAAPDGFEARGGPGGREAISGLNTTALGVLGNLPPKAQELLQAPLLRDQRVQDCGWHYEGFEHYLKVFVMFLAGHQDVTVAVGQRVIPVGHTPRTAHWSLTCYRASVVRRIGR